MMYFLRPSAIVLLLLLMPLSFVMAQKYDFNWLYGEQLDNYPATDEVTNLYFNFNNQPVTYGAVDTIDMVFYFTRTAVSDRDGNLLFYANGCEIKDRLGNVMPNGTNLNPGDVHDNYCPSGDWDTYPGGPQSMLSIPQPGTNDSVWYIFHLDIEFSAEYQGSRNLYYSVIDLRLNDGLGAVTEKNVSIATNPSASMLTFSRSADLSSYWINMPGHLDNRFNTIKLDSSGVEVDQMQTIGEPGTRLTEGGAMAKYSPDGQTLAIYSPRHGLRLYDFNRESGELSNDRFYPSPASLRDSSFFGGVESSPSGRFLYLATGWHIEQLDLEADDLIASQVRVASLPSDTTGLFLPAIDQPQLGPDCRMYVFCLSCYSVAIIHRPDEKGVACMVEQEAITTEVPYFRGTPIYPKYRMKELGDDSSICDHVTETVFSNTRNPVAGSLPEVLVYPNPADHYLRVLFSEPISGLHWSIVDAVGRTVNQGYLDRQPEQLALEIDVSKLRTGSYWLQLRDAAGRSAVRRVVVRT